MAGGDIDKLFKGTGWRGTPAPPNAPAGGAGPGFSRVSGPLGAGSPFSGFEAGREACHPLSPAARLRTVSGEAASDEVDIEYGSNARRLVVSEYTLKVLKAILRAAGLSSALITSTSRTPADQARAMYDNLERQGIEKQKKLYGNSGDEVIDVYVKAKAAKKSKNMILAEMEAKIKELGPSRVSQHCRTGALLQVVDVAPGSINRKAAFVRAVEAERRVATFLCPPADPAYHLEIPQPESPVMREDAPPPPAPLPPPKKKQKTWIEFQFVDDATGRPIPDIRFIVATPDGIENYHTTNSSGKAKIEDIEPGKCDLRCDLKDALLADTLDFVKTGGPVSTEGPLKLGPDLVRVAEIEAHKVKKGESIDSLAKGAGMTWQELAKFNWETDVPEQINQHLRKDVGCTRKTARGGNYLFDDADVPGIVYLPNPWSLEGAPTGVMHIFRVAKAKTVSRPYIFSF